ncbi:MAG: hypothetical protein JXK93_02225 [Sphaerochaetaceae bacterium]|nr:hypothetical protein [Sphaerochaetaceae bacterium]
MNIFHYRPQGGFLHRVHPLIKILLLILLSTLNVQGSTLFSALSLLFALSLTATTRVPLVHYTKEMRYFSLIILIVALSRYFTTESIEGAFKTLCMFTSMILFSILLMDSTPVDEAGRAVSLLFVPFGKKVVREVAAITELTLMMIPLFLDTAQTILSARKARGEQFTRHPIRSLASFTDSLLNRMFLDIERLEDALVSRQYSPENQVAVQPILLSQVLILFIVACTALWVYFLA